MNFDELERSFLPYRGLGERVADGILVAAGTASGIDVVRKEVATRDPWLARREVVVMRVLQYERVPGVLRLLAHRTVGMHTVMYTPYWAGGDLLDSLETEPDRWPLATRVRTWHHLMEILQLIHAAGVAHRDIKPENVLVAWDGRTPRVCFADFGLSTYLKRRRCSNSGTLTYAAPEVLGESRFDLVATDVWAMGVLLFLLLYSDLPFSPRASRCSTVAAIQTRIRLGHYEHPAAANVPPALTRLVDRMLDTVPARRPSPAAVLADEGLRAVLAAPALLSTRMAPLPYSFVAYRSSSGAVSDLEYEACLQHEDARAQHARVITPPGS